MADIAVPELTDLDGALQLLCPVSSGSTSINPAMTQRGDSSSEEEAQKPGDASTSKATAGKKKRTQFSSCDACVSSSSLLSRFWQCLTDWPALFSTYRGFARLNAYAKKDRSNATTA